MSFPTFEHKPLGDIATITMGATVSYYSKTALEGEEQARLITASCLSPSGSIDASKLTNVWMIKDTYEKFLAESGDVLLLTRGNFRAVCIDSADEDYDLLVSANFAIIRPQFDLHPRALKELLSMPAVIDDLVAPISANKSIRTKELKQLQVPLLPYEVQKQIIELAEARDLAYGATLELAKAQLDAANTRIAEIMGA